MPNEPRKIGLALSGGGHRAAVFHLGVLARLADGNLLDQIEVVSTVSGGSIAMALVYAFNKNGWISGQDYKERIVKAIRTFLTQRNLEMDIALEMLRMPYNMIFRRQANALAGALRKNWCVTGNLGDLDPHPQWIINTMTVETGKNWRFDRNVMGDYVTGYTTSSKFPISSAVAASGGFPVFIGPFGLRTKNYRFVQDYATALRAVSDSVAGESLDNRLNLQGQHTLHFWDGGMYDNLGVQPLLRRFRFNEETLRKNMQVYRELRLTDHIDVEQDPKHHSSRDLDFMIVSDASAINKPEPYNRFLSFWRMVSLPVNHTRMMYSAQVVAMLRVLQDQEKENHELPKAGAYLQFDNTVSYLLLHAQTRDKMLADVPPETIKQISDTSLTQDDVNRLGNFGTRLHRLTEQTFDDMYRHGYEQADATLYAYNPGLGKASEHIPFDRKNALPVI